MNETRFDPMMLESQWRDQQRDQILSQHFELANDVALATKIFPTQFVAELCLSCPNQAEFDAAVRNTVLAEACLRALATASDKIKLEALGVLAEITPRSPDSTLLNCVLGTLMGFSVNATVSSALRYRAAQLIDELCCDLK